jgi:hypothetical protein
LGFFISAESDGIVEDILCSPFFLLFFFCSELSLFPLTKEKAGVCTDGLVLSYAIFVAYKNAAFTVSLASKLVTPGNTYFAVAEAPTSMPETAAPDQENTEASAQQKDANGDAVTPITTAQHIIMDGKNQT